MNFIDTHTHPHMEDYALTPEEFMRRARGAGVSQLICIGTDADDSERAIAYASKDDGYYASVGIHPHEAKSYARQAEALARLIHHDDVVAIGECGLDYYYENSPKEDQARALRGQIELALSNDLPLVFHVRDAFDDFFTIFDEYAQKHTVRGVVHSFTSDVPTMQACVDRGLYIGLNGIMTFTKDPAQIEAARTVPLERMVLETDSPFLTPVPFRGTVNDSAHVKTVAEFLHTLRGESLDVIARRTTENAKELFRI